MTLTEERKMGWSKLGISRWCSWRSSCCIPSRNTRRSARCRAEEKVRSHRMERMFAGRILRDEIDEYLLDREAA